MTTMRTGVRSKGLDNAGIAALRRGIEADMAKGRHHGAVLLVARHGEILVHEALGTFDRGSDRPLKKTDRFLLASTTKSITAAAVLRLVDRGEVTLDTPVAEIIPEFAVRGKQRVTLYHLLNHTGGTWPYFGPPPPLTGADMANMAKMVAAVCAQQLAHRPGEVVVYNPWADFTLVGEIIQRISKRKFRDFLNDEIFSPLGMSDSSVGLPVDHPDRVPIRVTDLNPGAVEANTLEALNLLGDGEEAIRPSGGIFSTAVHVFKFAEMLRLGGTGNGARILSQALTDYALQNHTGDRPNTFWDFSKESRNIPEFPANFTLVGGYTRGSGHYLTPLGQLATPRSFGGVGAGSTLFMVDPERELTLVFLTAGLMEGLGHFQRLQRISDLALAAAI